MGYPSSSSLPSAKSKGYRHRSRPPRTSERTAATNYGKHSSFRHRPKLPTPKGSRQDESIVICFPVPSILTTKWLIRTAPIVLAHHLIYARGLWPMSVSQLLLLQQQDNTQQESNSIDGLPNHHRTRQDKQFSRHNKRQRLNNGSRINPSLKRKQQRAMDQITRLSNEWRRYVTATSYSAGYPNADDHECIRSNRAPLPFTPLTSTFSEIRCQQQKQQQKELTQTKMPLFLLILLGSSYGKGRELYLLDFQSLIDEDDQTCCSANDANTAQFTQEQEKKYEAMLARKLITALMNHSNDDERPSVSNSLPAPSSPSFRLWFTVGFESRHTSDDFEDGDELMKSESASKAGCGPCATYEDNDSLALATHTAIASPLSTVSWIPRTEFPIVKQQSRSRSSSRTQSLITIRFVRSRKQNQPMQLQRTSQTARKNNNEEEISNHVTQSSNPFSPSSEQLEWMSLSTHVKGFRL